MQNNANAYFKQQLVGESSWWSWAIGFWFIVFGWFIAQNFIGGAIPFVAMEVDEELARAFMNAGVPEDQGTLIKMFALLGVYILGAIFTIIFWIINRNAKGGAKKVFGLLTGITAFTSFIALFVSIPMMNSPEMSELLSKVLSISPMSYALMLLTFPGALVGVYLVQKFIHKRSILSLHTAAKKFRWKRAFQGLVFMWGVLAITTAGLHITGLSEIAKIEFNPAKFFKFALVSLLLIPLQSATEEIFFRGYLNQAGERILKSKWTAFIITSLLFMCVHLANPEAREGAANGILPLVMSGYFLFGFIACLMVFIDGGLESAIGVHVANNTFAAVAVNYEGSVLPTPSLYMATPKLSVDLPTGVVSLAAVTLLLYFTRKPLDPLAEAQADFK